MSDTNGRPDSVDQAAGAVVATALTLPLAAKHPEVAAGAVVVLQDLVSKITQRIRNESAHRLNIAASVLVDGTLETVEDVDVITTWVEEPESFGMETVRRLLEDDEGTKAWAYGALLRAFHADVVPKEARPRWLRLVRNLFNADLVELVQAAEFVNIGQQHDEGGSEHAVLLAHLAAAGFADAKSATFKACEAASTRAFSSSGAVVPALREFDAYMSGNYLSETVLKHILPVLREGALRTGIYLPTRSDFLASALAHREREER